MGSVYLAEDTQLQRRVALKVASYGTKDGSEARKRLLAEARAAATLDHPYLCPVYDVGEIDGRLYLTMAYIEGQSLAESTRGKSLPPRQVAALVGKLAVALQEAHAKGVIHRDLKPSNVMIKATGPRREPVIVDFGLARRDDASEARLTKTGQVMGTLDYMAPEQIRGELKEIGPACDIYALGVILYELLTGRLPFEGSGLAVVGQILTQAPLAPVDVPARPRPPVGGDLPEGDGQDGRGPLRLDGRPGRGVDRLSSRPGRSLDAIANDARPRAWGSGVTARRQRHPGGPVARPRRDRSGARHHLRPRRCRRPWPTTPTTRSSGSSAGAAWGSSTSPTIHSWAATRCSR